MSFWGFPKYVCKAEKQAKAAKKLEQLRKKREVRPVILQNSTIARTWWGKSWNQNLERYADYSNRIGRGRSYVRHGAVLDLQISTGGVTALVQGSRSKPYEISVKIKKLSKTLWQEIAASCSGRFNSLPELIAGKFPKELGDLFLRRDAGLFPSPKEITFTCSCPDWAKMCKHVAATLYGVSARLDEDATLLFTLRGTNTDDLDSRTVTAGAEKLLEKAAKKSSRVIEDADLTELFGINVAEGGWSLDTSGSEMRASKSGNTRSRKSRATGSVRDAVIAEGKRDTAKKKVLRKPKTRKKTASLSRKKRG